MPLAAVAQLMGDALLERARLDIFEDALVLQKVVEGAADPAFGFLAHQAASALARCPRSKFSISASKNASSKLCAAFNLGSQCV